MNAPAKEKGARQPRAPYRPTVAIVDRAAGWYAVSSQRAPDQRYMTRVTPGAEACNCPAGEFRFDGCRAGVCKHVLAARVLDEALAALAALADAVAARTPIMIDVDRGRVACGPWQEGDTA